jgi:hypothetical protein
VEVGASRDCSGCNNPGLPTVDGGRETEDDLGFDAEEDFELFALGRDKFLQQTGFPKPRAWWCLWSCSCQWCCCDSSAATIMAKVAVATPLT